MLAELGLSLLLAGCDTGPSSIGELETDSASDSGQASDDAAGSTSGSDSSTDTDPDGGSTVGDDAGDSGTTGVPVMCGPMSQCTLPVDCGTEAGCGGILDRAEADGCPRTPCESQGDCPAGTTCFVPYDWGHCGQHLCADDDETGQCECSFGLDCNTNALCVPDEVNVPTTADGQQFCDQFLDEGSCTGSGLNPDLGSCHWYSGFSLPNDGTCGDQVETARCMYARSSLSSPADTVPCPSDEALHPLMLDDGANITVLFIDPEFPPFPGFDSQDFWTTCADDPERCFCGCPEA